MEKYTQFSMVKESNMPKFRKKPVEVEAFQMTLERRWNNVDWPEWLHEAWNKDPGEGALWPNPDDPPNPEYKSADRLVCGTLEGVHVVDIDDWIIKGIKGELYPCKPDIFKATYEEVE